VRTPEPQPAKRSNLTFPEMVADVLELLNGIPPLERVELLPLLLQAMCGKLPEA
jgi:hypothetical protein